MTLMRFLAAATMAVAPFYAAAQGMKPGLWEMSNKLQSGSGQVEQSMAQMQQQMASMPPEQRKMMQDMMAKQGVSMSGSGGTSMKVCITKEMAERNDIPAQQSGDCRHASSPRSGNTMKMSFSCTNPPSSGEGTVTFAGSEAFTMKMTVNTAVQGKPEKMNMDGSGKWLSADCGSIKPMAVPRK